MIIFNSNHKLVDMLEKSAGCLNLIALLCLFKDYLFKALMGMEKMAFL